MANQVDLGQSIRIIRRLGHGGDVSFCTYEIPSLSDQQGDRVFGFFVCAGTGEF
jgi:hypothetical protein